MTTRTDDSRLVGPIFTNKSKFGFSGPVMYYSTIIKIKKKSKEWYNLFDFPCRRNKEQKQN